MDSLFFQELMDTYRMWLSKSIDREYAKSINSNRQVTMFQCVALKGGIGHMQTFLSERKLIYTPNPTPCTHTHTVTKSRIFSLAGLSIVALAPAS